MSSNVQKNVATPKQAKAMGLSEDEFNRISDLIERPPNLTELSIYSVLRKEQFSLKNTLPKLNTFQPCTPNRLSAPNNPDNQVIDLGDGIGCIVKSKSVANISAKNAFEKATKNTQEITRKIIAQRAQPIAQLNSIYLGNLENIETKNILKNLVFGIGNFSNTFGIPTVGEKLVFNTKYQNQPRVEIMSVGKVELKETNQLNKYSIGDNIFIIDTLNVNNIQYFTDKQKELLKHNFQTSEKFGEAYLEKLIQEFTKELIEKDIAISMQEIGNGFWISSLGKMAHKLQKGMEIQMDNIPTTDKYSHAEDIIRSNISGKIMLVVKQSKEEAIQQLSEKWDLQLFQIGKIGNGKQLKFHYNDKKVGELPIQSLVINDEESIYNKIENDRTTENKKDNFSIDQIEEPKDLVVVARKMLANPNIVSKKWVTRQLDNSVGNVNMSSNCPSDAAIINIQNTSKALALSMDSKPRYFQANASIGIQITAAEAARNVICSGGEPLAFSSALNLGNMTDDEILSQVNQYNKGLNTICTKLGITNIENTINLNRESKAEKYFSSSTVGILGVLQDKSLQTSMDFKYKGDLIFLIGESKNDINSSEYLATFHGIENSPPPQFDINQEIKVQDAVRQLIVNNYINAAHNVSDGGIFISLFEMGAPRGLGFDIVTDSEVREDAFLFGEAQSRILVTVIDDYEDEFIDLTSKLDVEVTLLGHVTQGKMMIDDKHFGFIADANDIYQNSLASEMEE